MSVRQALLALLDNGPTYGYQLRSDFESRTGGTWPLNIGQVYTTLSRLERDGLVRTVEGPTEAGHVVYEITEPGRSEVADWFATPVARNAPARDEIAIKLAMAVDVPDLEIAAVIQQQRRASIAALQDFTRLKRTADDGDDLAWSLVLDRLIFDAEAEVRWLDHCETRLARAARTGGRPRTGSPRSPQPRPSQDVEKETSR